MTVQQILEHEEASMGRSCKLVESATLHDEHVEVTVVLYQPEPLNDDRLGLLGQTRVVAYAGDRQLYSAIAAQWSRERAAT